MLNKTICSAIIVLLPYLLYSSVEIDSLPAKKKVVALRINSSVAINGKMDEPEWMEAVPAADFVQHEQYNGEKPSQKSEVRVLYDDNALYIGAMLYDDCPSCIYSELGQRDNSDNLKSDAFAVFISTYNDGLNYLKFIVSASGVQSDVKLTSDNEERSWNAVWESSVSINGNGWCVELKIPYSALRFSNKGDNSQWGINFARLIKRFNETSTWNYVDKSLPGFTTQSGILTGISGIRPPVRLSFSPYFSTYMNKLPEKDRPDYDINGGMDFKLGLSESFTLDMTLIPDFGQVKSDDKVLNLSPFEVKYDEARQFFTEGTELFSKGGIFYSRRIGSTPIGYGLAGGSLDSNEVVADNPLETKMVNATKLSGRTVGGLGVGFFNAMTKNTYATIRDTASGDKRRVLTQGFTNYNMLVLDQNLPHNSFISLTNTNFFVPRQDYTANVTASQFMIRDKKNRFGVEGTGAVSQIFDDSTTNGFKSFVALAKTSGNFQGDVWTNIESKNYNPNDMGYLQSANEFSAGVELSYEVFKPLWRLVQFETEVEYIHQMLYSPRNFTSQYITSNTYFTTKKQFTGGLYMELSPRKQFDYYEPRVDGYKLKLPSRYYMRWFGSPDYRKTLAVDHNIAYWRANGYGQHGYSYSVSPRIRFNDNFLVVLSWSQSFDYNDIGYYSNDGVNVVMGSRDVETITNTVELQWTFNAHAFINLRVRHYLRHYEYNSFYNLRKDGSLQSTAIPSYSNRNYNLFNLDLLYQWNFAPGSELAVVWKNSFEEYKNNPVNDYLDNIDNIISGPMYNSISVKILYYIDYQMLRKYRD